MSDAQSDAGIIIAAYAALAASIGTMIAVIRFWMGLSDRITKADNTANDALQEAAEAKNDFRQLSDKIDELALNLNDRMDRRSREDGDGLNAIRQKITEVELFMRDHFVRAPEFTATMSEIKSELIRIREKLEQRPGK